MTLFTLHIVPDVMDDIVHDIDDIVVPNYDIVAYTMYRWHIVLVSDYDVVVATTSGIPMSKHETKTS